MRAKNLAVMFTDMEGFTACSRKRSRYEIASLLKEHENIIKETASVFGGHIIKNLGDGLLIVFESGTDAVRCGVELQKDIKKHNTQIPKKEKFRIKIAIACGDVIIRNADVYGE